VRGFRVEPGEIERVLERHPAVAAAAVVGHEAAGGDLRLAAYVVVDPATAGPVDRLVRLRSAGKLHGGPPLRDLPCDVTVAGLHAGETPPEEEITALWSSPTALLDDLRRHLQAALPEAMVPASLSLLAELPLTPNGKLDRRALPAPEAVGFGPQRASEPPGTEMEKQLAQIWSAVVGSRRFGIRDSFFEIGGHSLLAIQVVARIRKEFAVEFNLRDFFDEPTVAGIARRVEAAEPVAASAEERIERLVRAAYRQGRPPVG
jgi:Phosphopantetheine attachment site/AMP-binding enzyme C-terminal domain